LHRIITHVPLRQIAVFPISCASIGKSKIQI
jgi:hypothetical protein